MAEQGFWGGAFNALGGMGKSMIDNPEQTAISLDMLGQGFDPKNPFAGIGTAIGKSSLASQAEVSGQQKSQDMFQKLLKALTPGDKQGPTSLTATLGKDGKGVEYGIKGLGELDGSLGDKVGGGTEAIKDLQLEAPALSSADFMKDFGEGL